MDYFEHYELLPIEIKTIIDEFCNGENSYENCANLVTALELEGWTCDYGLDAEPYNLHKIIE